MSVAEDIGQIGGGIGLLDRERDGDHHHQRPAGDDEQVRGQPGGPAAGFAQLQLEAA